MHSFRLIRFIFSSSLCSCNSNFIGYNWLYGGGYCKDYFPDNLVIGNLIREIHSAAVIPKWLL